MEFDFTDREKDLTFAAKVDDILPINGRLLRLASIDQYNPGMFGFWVAYCEWTARCGQQAAQLVPHPILTYVPACDRCARNSGKARDSVSSGGVTVKPWVTAHLSDQP